MSVEEEKYIIRSIRRDDSRRIWEIRNHPDVRVRTNNPEAFDFESHDQWFERKYFSGKDNLCFTIENNESGVIGYCRYDFDGEHVHYVVSIALDPDHHGKGLGHLLLGESLKQFGHAKPGAVIFAEIKKDNVPSLKLFMKNGFIQIGGDSVNDHFTYTVA